MDKEAVFHHRGKAIGSNIPIISGQSIVAHV
jgi:hypothetical protein